MENFRIESLEINKIGAFEHLKMDFPKKKDPEKAEIHILTGENGTGKTTILEVLSHSIFPLDKNLNSGRTKHLFLKIPTLNGCNFEVTNNKDSVKFSREMETLEKMKTSSLYEYYKKTQLEYTTTYFDYAFFAYSGYRKIDEYKPVDISKLLNHSPFDNALDFSKSTNTEYLLQWIGNYSMKFLRATSANDNIKALFIIEPVFKICQIIEEIIEKPVAFQLSEELDVRISIDGISQHFNAIPDGVRSIVSWVGDLIMRLNRIQWNDNVDIFDRNFILFLDEIEVHLHPAWQRKILPVVQKLFKNAQIFISTHSPFVVGSVDGAWVHKLKKDGAYAVLDGEPVLSEDAESYSTILEEVFGIKKRFGDPIEDLLVEFRAITREILKGNEDNIGRWNEIISIFENQERPDEIMSVIKPIRNQINRIRNQAEAIY
jgi:predicted ATP-binding protein involved in virulence